MVGGGPPMVSGPTRPQLAVTLTGMGDGDGWATCELGHRHWGRHGAAGLLLYHPDPEPYVLLQHRALLSSGGGTWGLLGGAVHSHEDAVAGALREASEESTLDPSVVRVHGLVGEYHGGWAYETVIASVAVRPDVRRASFETAAVAWVHADEVPAMKLFPPFANVWPRLRRALVRPVLVVDAPAVLAAAGTLDGAAVGRAAGDGRAANRGRTAGGDRSGDAASTGVHGADDGAAASPLSPLAGSLSRPAHAGPARDATAVRRLRDRLAALGGVPELPGTAADISYPEVVLLVDPAGDVGSVPGVLVVARGDAGGDGIADPLTAGGFHEHRVVVTSDPALGDRAASAGVPVLPPHWLIDRLH